jgi:hypothetical protein
MSLRRKGSRRDGGKASLMYGQRFWSATVAVAVLLTAKLSASAASPAFVDPVLGYHVTLPTGCHANHTAQIPRFITCGNGYAMAFFAGGGTDRPALQKLVNRIIGDWSGLKLLQNQMVAKLDGRPQRLIYAEGRDPKGITAAIEILAVVNNGGWFTLVFAAPQNEWSADALRYFSPIKASFHLDPKPSR